MWMYLATLPTIQARMVFLGLSHLMNLFVGSGKLQWARGMGNTCQCDRNDFWKGKELKNSMF